MFATIIDAKPAFCVNTSDAKKAAPYFLGI